MGRQVQLQGRGVDAAPGAQNLVSLYWVGRTKDAATFGKAWDTWRNETADPNSVAGQLSARFVKCGTNLSRRGYDVHD